MTFGGCHSEYVHLNDVNVFQLDNFVRSNGMNRQVNCVRLDFKSGESVPDSRWGHAAAVHDDKVLILGGRNEKDICDLYSLDLSSNKWTEIKVLH